MYAGDEVREGLRVREEVEEERVEKLGGEGVMEKEEDYARSKRAGGRQGVGGGRSLSPHICWSVFLVYVFLRAC